MGSRTWPSSRKPIRKHSDELSEDMSEDEEDVPIGWKVPPQPQAIPYGWKNVKKPHHDLNYFVNESVDISNRRNQQSSGSSKQNCPSIWWIIAIISIAFCSYLATCRSIEKIDVDAVKEEMNKLKPKYKQQSKELWAEFESSLRSIDAVNTIILLHSDDVTAKCLAKDLALSVTKNITSKEYKTRIVQPEDLSVYKEFGELLEELKYEMEVKHSLVVLNLEQFPIEFAPMFHTICDIFEPFVAHSYLFITLKSHEIRTDIGYRKQAVYILKELWRDLPDAVLDPLITRMTGRVVRVIPQNNVWC